MERSPSTLRLPIGRYEYKYVIDGKTWKNDPGNMAQVGSYLNNVLVVGPLEPPRVSRQSDGTYAATFRYRPPAPIKNVSVVGTFNHWKPAAQMQGPDREGWYAATMAIPEGRQEYKFLVDGKSQVPDPGNAVHGAKRETASSGPGLKGLCAKGAARRACPLDLYAEKHRSPGKRSRATCGSAFVEATDVPVRTISSITALIAVPTPGSVFKSPPRATNSPTFSCRCSMVWPARR